MNENKKAWAIILTALAFVIVMVMCIPTPPKEAKAGRQYRVSVYAGNSNTPIRSWVVNDYQVMSDNVVTFESIGKRVKVCNNWVVEEQ